jgi:hypothetical protein
MGSDCATRHENVRYPTSRRPSLAEILSKGKGLIRDGTEWMVG